MIQEGERAPDFELRASDGQRVRLSALEGRPVVLYFYPKDMTPGCTQQACAFRDVGPALGKRGVTLLGVSPDSLPYHRAFAKAHRLKFPLLSDPDHRVARAYGAFGEKTLYGKTVVGMIRSTFVIDATGCVRKAFRRVRVDGHAARVLAALDAL